MILTCPSCGTQYVVKDGAIPEGGRQVRCASCKHSWHQDPEVQEAGDEVASPPSESSYRDEPDRADITPQAQEPENPGFEVDEPAVHDTTFGTPDEVEMGASETMSPSEELQSDVSAPVFDTPVTPAEEELEATGGTWYPPAEDDFAPFGARDEAEGERRSSPLLKLLIVVLLVAAAAAAFWFLAPPEWKSRVGVADAGTSELKLMLTNSQRQQLASGNMLLAVTGRVVNPTDETQRVPPIEAELRKTSGELVYRWTIAPPATSLPPGGRAPFNSAEMNVPADGDMLTIAFGAAA
ncbi:hypothetical protein G7077_07240 [Sphingomonas piscis]|uniref:Zinc finger/thioredoxin putative domain-containing protein n=1 Tax=Sphingomonas piscis TaxID=2714943 RepID=A0A6G7YPQ4_9SPHN|nr:zinc-ribbon domain-containing protein [Sphingomonas piscis]QIK78719.1 hypothetical protein G7077_07240 [Sphingomonas piscis]